MFLKNIILLIRNSKTCRKLTEADFRRFPAGFRRFPAGFRRFLVGFIIAGTYLLKYLLKYLANLMGLASEVISTSNALYGPQTDISFLKRF